MAGGARATPGIGSPVETRLHVVAVDAARRGADQAVVAATRHGHRSDGCLRQRVLAALRLAGGFEHVVAQCEILQAPGVGRRVALVCGDDVAPVPLPHLQPSADAGLSLLVG